MARILELRISNANGEKTAASEQYCLSVGVRYGIYSSSWVHRSSFICLFNDACAWLIGESEERAPTGSSAARPFCRARRCR